ncbi:unnamed protein product [Closterium sp. NIES-54]
MPLYFAAEQDGRVGDAYGHRDGADDAASHGHEAPLVAPCSATGRLGAQLPRTGVSAFGDDAARAAIREESTYDGGARGWEVLDLTDNKVVTTVEAIFYETMSLEAWKAEHNPISTRKPAVAPTDPSLTTAPLLVVEDDDVEDVTPPSAPTSTSPLPLVADLRKTASPSAVGDEGSIAASPLAPARGIAAGQRDEMHLG